MKYANNINVSGFGHSHVQGIAVDAKREYMYLSFTTSFVKTDMKGNVVGSVNGLLGHLGCIAYNYDDGKVYGSLEYKNDAIGQGIMNATGKKIGRNAFYIAIFDVDKIDRLDMDAEKDGIMTAVFMKETYDDFSADGHRYGCSGMDGTTIAPLPGKKDGKFYLYTAYGIYSDLNRKDNDHQVILRYDMTDWAKYAKPLNQNDVHTSGPEKCDGKYFVYTGNTNYGVQNLEYDPFTGHIFAAVYRGAKPNFPNYDMFVLDLAAGSKNEELKGVGHDGDTLALAEIFEYDEKSGIYGSRFPHGSTGMISLGDGYFYFSEPYTKDGVMGTNICLYKYDEKDAFIKVEE